MGEGGYEEVNAVTAGGQNFGRTFFEGGFQLTQFVGWPCWEGPFPMPRMRDSPLNSQSKAVLFGNKLNCSYMYNNIKTELPFFFWSR